VCVGCGAMKVGAWTPCGDCGWAPHSEDDLVLALACSDRQHDRQTLDRLGSHIARGGPVELAPETRSRLLQEVRGSRRLSAAGDGQSPQAPTAALFEDPEPLWVTFEQGGRSWDDYAKAHTRWFLRRVRAKVTAELGRLVVGNTLRDLNDLAALMDKAEPAWATFESQGKSWDEYQAVYSNWLLMRAECEARSEVRRLWRGRSVRRGGEGS
jgi:hypothetical protein